MAAAGETHEMQEPKFVEILSEEVFTKENNKTKEIYDELRQYKDGEESIKYLPFRLYESYEQYKSEQEMTNKIIQMKYDNGEKPHKIKAEIET